MIVTRFAPSPTGLLHLGHAYSVLCAEALAQTEPDGRLILRIEDIDITRCRPEFEAALHDDLGWLGVRFQGPVWRQSERTAFYRDALDRLISLGVVYRCFRARSELAAASAAAPHGPETAPTPGPHSSEEEAALLSEGRPYAWRLSSAALACRPELRGLNWRDQRTGFDHAVDPTAFGDPILARKDVPTSYHLSSVVDDAAQGITHIVRGTDLLDAVPIHRVLQALLGYPPPAYHHHDLILDAHGRRFAKRDRALTLQAIRAAGVTAADIRGAFDAGIESFSALARRLSA